ncbi:MAG: cation diffusion facilitator family transporter [Bdellovibrionales bacterium]|nr:cation diffusion facilitator family transporter [Bdellovibrionales bacterium]
MTDSCCANKEQDLKALASKQAMVLWVVLVINFVMFLAEFLFGWISDSTALIGDSIDMLGDAFTYGSSLYVVNRKLSAKILASRFKAYLMIVLGLIVFVRAIYRFLYQVIPEIEIMGIVGVVALLANLICLALLTRHKSDDINFASVWICSRNDIIANTSVLVAVFLVYQFEYSWPDIIVGLGITILFLRAAFGVLRDGNKLKA